MKLSSPAWPGPKLRIPRVRRDDPPSPTEWIRCPCHFPGGRSYPARCLAMSSRTAGTRSTGTSIAVGGRLVRGLILGDRFLVRLRLVVLQNAADALRIPPVGISRLLHDFLLRRRRSALIALAPSGYAVMTKTDPSRPGRSSSGLRRMSSTSRSSKPPRLGIDVVTISTRAC
jgi:hypothetical protein